MAQSSLEEAGRTARPGAGLVPCRQRGRLTAFGLATLARWIGRRGGLTIAYDGAVAMIAPPSEVVDADHRERVDRLLRPPSHNSQQCVIADGQHQAFGKTGRGAATQGQSKMMDDVLQAASAPGQWRENAIGEPFREHLSPTQNRVTAKAPDHHPQINAAPGKRQIGRSAKISAVNSPRENTARRACTVELP